MVTGPLVVAEDQLLAAAQLDFDGDRDVRARHPEQAVDVARLGELQGPDLRPMAVEQTHVEQGAARGQAFAASAAEAGGLPAARPCRHRRPRRLDHPAPRVRDRARCTRVQIRRIAAMSWDTKRTDSPDVPASRTRSSHARRNSESPTASTSSASTTSAPRQITAANPSWTALPPGHVPSGSSACAASPEKSRIASSAALDLSGGNAGQPSVDLDVLPYGEIRREADAEFEHRDDAAPDGGPARRRMQEASQDLRGECSCRHRCVR